MFRCFLLLSREGPVAASEFVTNAIIRGISGGANSTQVTLEVSEWEGRGFGKSSELDSSGRNGGKPQGTNELIGHEATSAVRREITPVIKNLGTVVTVNK
jgi:hypothetical protein